MLTVLVSLCAALVLSKKQLAETRSQLESQRAEIKAERKKFHYLNVSDPANIAAVQMPKLGNFKLWQWRVHVPAGKSFGIRVAYDPKSSRTPGDNQSRFCYDLDPGESIVSVSFEKFKGEWKLVVAAESEIQSSQRRSRVECKNTQFLEDGSYGDTSAGRSGTSEADPTKPFRLMHLRAPTFQADGKRLPWKNAKHGVMLWIEEQNDQKE